MLLFYSFTELNSLLVSNLPLTISEKDLYLVLMQNLIGLEKSLIIDDPCIKGKSTQAALLFFSSNEQAV